MDAHTRENSIKALSKLLDVYQGQLDASVVAEVREVIAALEHDHDAHDVRFFEEEGVRVLKVICDVLRIVTNITDLMG